MTDETFTATYERNVRVADYESKKLSLSLTRTYMGNDQILAATAFLVGEVHRQLGIEAPKTAANPIRNAVKSDATTVPNASSASASGHATISPRITNGDPVSAIGNKTPKSTTPDIEEDDDELGGQVSTPAAAQEAEEEIAPPKEVALGTLTKHIGQKMGAKNTDEYRAKMGKAIENLIKSFVPEGAKKSHSNIPVERRQEFLDKLDALK